MSLLLTHNARMTQILAPAVPADPQKGIAGAPRTVRWSGSVDAYVDEDTIDAVRGGARVQLTQTTVDVPANIPVWPNEEDLITVTRLGSVARYSPAAPQVENLIVRKIDGGLLMLGKIKLTVVRS